jgi:DNA-binding IclR family transcriptional regulator
VGTSDLPESVRSLIRRHVASVLELEVLLAMHDAAAPLSCPELARELRLNETACAAALDKFTEAGLVESRGDAYGFKPRTPALRDGVDALSDSYARRRVSVIRFIYKRPGEGISAFADAFKLRKDDD